MDPGPQPEFARGLTPVEEMMCSAAVPFMSIYTHAGSRQRKCSGSHINICQDIQGFANKLPRHVADIPYIWVSRSNNDELSGDLQSKIFKVRPKKILGLLQGLKDNEVMHYENIEIDYDYINSIEEGVPLDINHIVVLDSDSIDNNSSHTYNMCLSIIGDIVEIECFNVRKKRKD